MNVLLTGWSNELFKVVLSLSLSGSLLILALLAVRLPLQNCFSRRWQYYIWLAPLARLLLPFAPRANLMNSLFNAPQPNAILPYWETVGEYQGAVSLLDAQQLTSTSAVPRFSADFIWLDYAWLVWLAVALLLMMRKITAYQSFAQYVRSGQRPVEDLELLNRLAEISADMGLKKPVELAVNPQLATPLLLGLRRPCIVLPNVELSAADFAYTVRHELVHYQRRDMLYKWLVQLTVCLHWFNPLVWLLEREVGRSCELACDEAVIGGLDADGRTAYGDMLFRAAEYGGGWQNTSALNLSQNTKLLKERLRAIMRFKKKTKIVTVCSLLLAVFFVIEATAVGAYTIPKAAPQSVDKIVNKTVNEIVDKTVNHAWLGNTYWEELAKDWEDYWEALGNGWENLGNDWENYWDEYWQPQKQQAPQYFAQNDVARMSMIFDELTQEEQNDYLAQAYADNNIAMFAVFLDNMAIDAAALQAYAAKAYTENRIDFLAVLADQLPQKQLAELLERAKVDQKESLQLILLKAAGRYDEAAALEEKMERQQQAEYARIGVTIEEDGRYYYQGQLIHVLLDTHTDDQSCHRLQINPEGAVSIKILRDEAGNILSVNQMNAAEVNQLIGDLAADDDEDDWDEEDDWDK